MNIQALLNTRIHQAMLAAGAPSQCTAMVRQSAKAQFGDYQANGMMAAAKQLKANPRAFAQSVLEHDDLSDICGKTEIAGPGFINITLKPEWLASQLQGASEDARLGIEATASSQNIVVDYSSPNLAKEMHVGHLRSTVIGDSVARTLAFLGHNVIRQNHVGDWGTQFGMLLAYMEQLRNEEATISMALSDLENFYRDAKKCFDDSPEFANRARELVVLLQSGDQQCLDLWQEFIDISLAHCQATYDILGVSLKREHVMPESAYNADLPVVVADLEKQGLLVESDGAKCVFLEEFSNKEGEILPIIVQKSGGGYLYATTDLAALRYRQGKLQFQRGLYFVDARQSLHFQQVFTLARKAGYVAADTKLQHMPFGTVMGSDGKPFKTRSGTVAKLSELLEEAQQRALQVVTDKNPEQDPDVSANIARVVGIAAVKYADLSKNRSSDYVFNWDTMLSFEGNTAPYLLYAYTRIASILRRADEATNSSPDIKLIADQERKLAIKLLQFSEALEQTADDGG